MNLMFGDESKLSVTGKEMVAIRIKKYYPYHLWCFFLITQLKINFLSTNRIQEMRNGVYINK
jgi:hypothetical protein